MASSSSSERVASEITPADSRIVADNKHKMDLSALAEVKNREDSLNKDVQIAKECISSQEIDDLVAATKRLVVESSEAGFDEDSIKKRDKAALIASTAKLESELHEIRAEGQEDILVCPNFYPTGLSKNVKTDAEALGGSSVQEPKIDWKLTAEIDFTSPTSTPPAFINIVDHPCLLWDVKYPKKDLTSETNWKDEGRGGPVRNQGDHDNCWTYSATDVYSSHRLRNEEDEAFRVMSARYLTFYVSKEERERERRHGDRNTHHCHGFRVIHGLRFIKEHGVPEESPRDAKTDYSCIKNPPSRTQKLFHFGADVEFMESDKIEDLQKMLLHQPVSANMILYYPEYDKILTLEEIYEGPTSEKSLYGGIHAVLVLAIIRFLGKLVALVKLSHGTKAGESGYMYVSLSKMIVNVEYSVEKNLLCQLKRKTEDAIAEPSYLLRNFTGVNYGDSPVAVARTSKKRKLN
ncbi:BnaAnng26390D [Brassica napus]|uniref:BnaAnng26390D protein n=1 Tax=Brassica napus TaxID=3708 RepID=A0A078JRX2_BRANA|nr:BnaAnng26390D [Brassica napus]